MSTVISDKEAKRNLAANLAHLIDGVEVDDKPLTNAYLAREIGVSCMTITHWRQGQRMAGSGPLARMAEFFGVSTDSMLAKPPRKKSRISA